AQRAAAAINTTYNDTITLNPGSYRLVVSDSGCDGLNWWAYTGSSYDPGIGSLKVTPATSIVQKPLKGYFSGDFGCGFTQAFAVAGPLGVTEVVANNNLSIQAYPNPAQNDLTVSINGAQTVKGTLRVIDALGRVVLERECTEAQQRINTGNFANGLYTIDYVDSMNPDAKLITRVLIAR
ncbi:MAG: T9SS type A sorting domain-containing protein, partial [Flavipsychrobacter sp.]